MPDTYRTGSPWIKAISCRKKDLIPGGRLKLIPALGSATPLLFRHSCAELSPKVSAGLFFITGVKIFFFFFGNYTRWMLIYCSDPFAMLSMSSHTCRRVHGQPDYSRYLWSGECISRSAVYLTLVRSCICQLYLNKTREEDGSKTSCKWLAISL